ncbi:TIGR01244 family sulfur transferase [Pseudoroseicyclus tamaricis]|uniref:TIGR01244 family phosphatase n=1 Tax=Pseudoroseicyclus tamaricis TaxID=2705421 RepID=A0A6B2JRU2_9RHOB|nr:TIGR01244 family sulfur transferase [Pseudoroseicyclus tamaricis]NDV00918.1 TIGR01244 family phosphatase [Pseudoroseicyclus tamaricis]
MDIRHLTDTHAVAPQILPEDMATLAADGFTTVICNRPDEENPPELQSPAMREAAEAAGLSYHYLPVTRPTITADVAAEQASIIASAEGKALAYCASGTRCSMIWSIGKAGEMSADEILDRTSRAGYDLSPMRPLFGG